MPDRPPPPGSPPPGPPPSGASPGKLPGQRSDDSGPLVRYFTALQSGRTESLAALEGRHPELASDFDALRRTWERLGEHLAAAWSTELTGPTGTLANASSGVSSALGDARLERLRARGAAEERYAQGREIARGGMGSIRAVWDTDLRRRLAMKVMLRPEDRDPGAVSRPPDGRIVARFLEEAQITAQLDHPGILPVHEIGLDAEGRLYFTMPLVEGRHLGEIFKLARAASEGWTTTRAVGVLLRVAEAVAFAHERSVVHRDLKPENVMVGRFGEAYVMDWGLARVLEALDPQRSGPSTTVDLLRARKRKPRDERVRTDRADGGLNDKGEFVTLDGDIVGTPGYMAPEQARGERAGIGRAADIYALGAILYQLLSGHAPHLDPKSSTSAIPLLERILEHEPAPLGTLATDAPDELVAIANHAMRRDPLERYPTAAAFAEDLRAYLEGRVVSAYERGALAQAKKWILRNRVLATAYALVALSVVGGSATFIRQQQASLGRLRAEQARTERARTDADAARQRAEAGETAATASSYAANMRAADLALRSGGASEARQRLADCPPQLRDFEWHHLNAQLDTSLARVAEVGDRLLCADFHPSGLLATLRALEPTRVEVAVWEAQSGARRFAREFEVVDNCGRAFAPMRGLPSRGGAVGFHPDGERIAVGLGDGQLMLICAVDPRAEPEVLARRNASSAPDRAGDAVHHVAWSSQGEWLAVALERRAPHGVALYRPAEGPDVVRILERMGRRPSAIAFDPGGPQLAVGYDDGSAALWNATADPEAGPTAVLIGHRGMVTTVGFAPDGATVATTSVDRTARVWKVEDGELVAVVRRPAGALATLAFTAESLGGGSDDGEITLWDPRDGRQTGVQRGNTAPALALGLAQDGERMWSVDEAGDWRVWDARLGSAVTEVSPRRLGRNSLEFSPDGTRMLIARAHSPEVWDAEVLEPVQMLAKGNIANGMVAFTADGRRVVGSSSTSGYVWDTATGRVLATLDPPPEWGGGAVKLEFAMAPERGFAALYFSNGFIAVYDLMRAPEDGSGLAPFVQWDVSSHLPRLRQVARGSRRLEMSADGQFLGVFDPEQSLKIYRPKSGALVAQIRFAAGEIQAERGEISAPFAFAPAGGMLAVAVRDTTGLHRRIALFDPATGRRTGTLDGHTDGLASLRFSPNGKRLASGADDGSVRLWDPIAGETLLVLDAHEEPAVQVAFSSDGTRFATLGLNRGVRIHETTPPRLRFESRTRNAAARRAAMVLFGGERTVPGLRVEESASEPVRKAIERLARLLADDPARLNMDAWEVVRRPGASAEEYQFALARAQAAVKAHPDDPIYRRTLGVARFRVGQLRLAIVDLEVSTESQPRRIGGDSDTPRPPGRPEEWAVRALAHYELSEVDKAELCRDNFEQLMAEPFYARDEDGRHFIGELEQVDERLEDPSERPEQEPASAAEPREADTPAARVEQAENA